MSEIIRKHIGGGERLMHVLLEPLADQLMRAECLMGTTGGGMNNFGVTVVPKLKEECENSTSGVGGAGLKGKSVLASQVYPNRARKYGYTVLIVYNPSEDNVWQNKKSVKALYARGFYQ